MFGLGLRPPFYDAAMQGRVPVDFFEVITENFMVDGGRPLQVLESVCSHYPVTLHGKADALNDMSAVHAGRFTVSNSAVSEIMIMIDICICNGVTDNDIRCAVASGTRDFEELRLFTGCSGGCGGCEEQARQVFSETIAELIMRIPGIAPSS
ncbi:MAG: multinuclear nonheme iron-dependent oxidase [Vulcanimicrobiaceae bacterium]